MIGLPKTLIVNDKEYGIESDYKVALLIFEAFNDVELNEYEKEMVLLECLYKNFNDLPRSDYQEAIKKAIWFLDGGKNYEKVNKSKKILDWEQDEQIIFSAVNKVANKEIRAEEYVHWWTFLGYFNEIGEGLLTTILNIRQKKINGKKLEKYEQEYYKNNKEIIDLKKKYSEEQRNEIDKLNKILS